MNSRRTVLIAGGRAPVALDLARSFSRHGHRVLIVESDASALSRSSRHVDRFFTVPAPNGIPGAFARAIAEIIARESVDCLIPTCEEIFHLAPYRELLSEAGARVWCDGDSQLQELHSKFHFNQRVRSLNLSAPLSFVCQSIAEGLEALTQLPGDRVVFKPEFSRFAASVRIVDRSEAEKTLRDISPDATRPWVLQQCVTGVEYCTYSLVHEGKILAHVAYDHEYTAGKGAGICFRAVDLPALERWVAEFAQKIQFTGQLAFDFIVTPQGEIFPLECNPRATSGMHLVSNEAAFLEAFLNPEQTSRSCVTPPPGRMAQIRLAMLIYGLKDALWKGTFRRWCNIFASAREVIFSWKDPLPFLSQFAAFYRFSRLALKRGVTPLEASTLDIEWNGPQRPELGS